MNDNEQVIADLKAAREVLVTRGRFRGKTIGPDGSVCILGALGIAAVEGYEQMDAPRRQGIRLYEPRVANAYNALSDRHPASEENVGLLYLYSDNFKTTDQDVLDLFDKTLADLGGLG